MARRPLKTYSRGGLACFLDACRGKLVSATPEEEVRQQVVRQLIAKSGYPQDHLITELRLSPSAQRADIVAFAAQWTGTRADADVGCLMVIECKKRGHPLPDHAATHQVATYAKALHARIAVVTNGADWCAYAVESDGMKSLDRVPTFEELQKGTGLKVTTVAPFKRWAYGNLRDLRRVAALVERHQLLGRVVGVDTPPEYIPLVADLYGCLSDASVTMPPGISRADCRILEDLGTRARAFGNNAGGIWYSPYFRSFLVERRGEHCVVSVAVIAQDRVRNHPRWRNVTGYSTLAVAVDQTVDDYRTGHLSMELKIEKSVRWKDDGAKLVHDGRLTRGGNGAMKVAEVKKYLRETAPDLLIDDEIVLGHIPLGRPLSLKKDAPLMLNLVRYALLRDDLRYSAAARAHRVAV